MSSKLILGCAVVIAAATVAGGLTYRVDASVGPIPLNCNRACLENVVDQYLAAVVAHNPKLVPLSADVKYTENDQRLDVGDGIWKRPRSGNGKCRHTLRWPTVHIQWIQSAVEHSRD